MANWVLAHRGARHRKRSGDQQPRNGEGGGLAIAVGSLLDGIPESIVIGVSTIAGGGISLVTVAAVFILNVPEGLSSSVGMRKAGRSALYVFGLWVGIAIISGIASLIGYAVFRDLSQEVVAGAMAVAAGAILAMLVDTMIPEAFRCRPRLRRADRGPRISLCVRPQQAFRLRPQARRRDQETPAIATASEREAIQDRQCVPTPIASPAARVRNDEWR